MKFGKEFKKQMVPEWTEANMDYNGLKRILREVRGYKQTKHPATHNKALQKKPTVDKTFSGLHKESSNLPSKGDIEDQVIDVNTLQHDGSGQIYKTKFLRQSEEGGEVEVMFFRKLDEELNKVCNFYKDKVEALMHEADVLNKQMDAFIALRVKVENPDLNGSSLKRCYLSNVSSKMPPTSTTCSRDRNPGREYVGLIPEVDTNDDHQQEESTAGPEVNSVSTADCGCDHREEVNKDDYKEDPLKILGHVKINNTLESPISTIKGVFKDSKEEDLSFNKEELRKVEERLRHVFVEFYHKLHLLKHYSFMNLAAFSKIMKKYEKITSRRAARLYMRVVDDSYLGNSDEVTGLLERVETTFIKNFSKSNRREGMKLLRPKAKRERHRVTFFSGFFLGCSIALLVAIVLRIEAHNLMDKEEGTQYMENIFPLYTLFAYIVLHMLMYAANIYFWRRYRVNYPFIFGFKRGTELGYREVFLLGTGLAVLASAGFLANLQLDMDSSTRDYKTITELVPLVLVIFVLLVTFCPLNILYRSSRFFFIKCIFRCICAPLYPVTLPDFFLADQLTSQVPAFRSFELYICYYSLGEYSRRQSKCLSHGVYNTFYFIVAVIPYWLRFLQCIRRLCEDKDAMHVYNGLKYFSTIVAVIIRTAFELKKGMTWMVLALVSSSVAALINTYWDIVIDWGLLRRQSKNKYLRDKLVVSHKSVYFAAMVLNIVLRFAWMQLVLEFRLRSLHKMTIITIFSCLEIIRRGIWSFFRLENEHLNNVGKYRAFKSVPLPFSYYETDNDDDYDDNDDDDKND
ncbi:phosphate transporter PHO1 homolog 10 [Quercus suber]|uniref:phosphate transporter PHO1 homolog 10 n=1 Tax=Quercus suber TaxID=58331 RepID=UPI0032E020A8